METIIRCSACGSDLPVSSCTSGYGEVTLSINNKCRCTRDADRLKEAILTIVASDITRGGVVVNTLNMKAK